MARYPTGSEAVSLIRQADEFARMPRRAEAILLYSRALDLEPECSYALVNRGLALQEENQLDAAVADYDRAIALDPDFGLAYYGRGWARHWRGDFAGELEDAQRGAKLDPENRNPYLRRIGAALQGLGKHWDAIAAYSEAIELVPNDEGTIYNRALCYLSMRKYYEALVDLNKALELDPDWSWALTHRAAVYAETDKLDLAQADIEMALRIDPKYQHALRIKRIIEERLKKKRGFFGRLFGG